MLLRRFGWTSCHQIFSGSSQDAVFVMMNKQFLRDWKLFWRKCGQQYHFTTASFQSTCVPPKCSQYSPPMNKQKLKSHFPTTRQLIADFHSCKRTSVLEKKIRFESSHACYSSVHHKVGDSEFGPSGLEEGQHGGILRRGQTVPVPDSAWACRLANINGYLSWCRNTYLSSAVGIAMIVEGQTPIAEYTGDVALLISGLNMIWGTWNYLYILVAQRHRVQMSLYTVLFSIVAAVCHLILWLSVILMYAAVWRRDETKLM